jgi:hypothetical protein
LRVTPDGMPDYVEDIVLTANVETDLEYLDFDSNGIPDIWQRLYFGWDKVLPTGDAPDQDGLSNFDEHQAGTSPLKKDHPLVNLEVSVSLR